jgi:hypothetical protein
MLAGDDTSPSRYEVVKSGPGESANINYSQGDKLTELAIDTIVSALMKLTNGNVKKTNAAMNLIGAGVELSGEVKSIVEAAAGRFNSEVFKTAMETIASRYDQRSVFIDESLTHLYGADGRKLIYWPK